MSASAAATPTRWRGPLALAVKDGRHALPQVVYTAALSLAGALVAHALDVDDVVGYWFREVVQLALIPLTALALGAQSLAQERADGTLAFLSTRPMSRRQALTVKLAVVMTTSLMLWLTGLLVVRVVPAAAASRWLTTLQAPASLAPSWSLALALTLGLSGFAASLLLAEPVVAALGAVLFAGCWLATVLGVAYSMGGSLEVALEIGPCLQLAIVSLPAALVLALILGLRADASTAWPLSRLVPLAAGVALLPWCLLYVVPTDFGLIRAAREGLGVVEASPVIPNQPRTAVAFALTTTQGSRSIRQAAIAFVGKSGAPAGLLLLPPGTSPIGWDTNWPWLVAEWSGGLVRAVSLDGRVVGTPWSAAQASEPLADPTLAVRDGQLILERDGRQHVLYPQVTGGAP